MGWEKAKVIVTAICEKLQPESMSNEEVTGAHILKILDNSLGGWLLPPQPFSPSPYYTPHAKNNMP
jgi:hypothetical protein